MTDLDPFGILPRMREEAIKARERVNAQLVAEPTLGPDGQRWFDDPEKQAEAKRQFTQPATGVVGLLVYRGGGFYPKGFK